MDRLINLARELKYPGVDKLYAAAREEGINVNRNQVKQLLATQGQRQVYRPVPPSKGATVSEAPGFRFQMDLIDFKGNPSKGFSVILVLCDVFTREIFAKPVPNKTPISVARVLEAMLPTLPREIKIISSDKGNEFKKEVAELLDNKGIVHRTKNVLDVNGLSVIDRAIQQIKLKIAEATEDGSEWADDLASIVAAYNKTPHQAVHGKPNRAATNDIQKFLILSDNAEKGQHNTQLLAARKKVLDKTKAFRQPKENLVKTFRRGFKAKFGPVKQIERIEGSTVLCGRKRRHASISI